MAEVMDMMTLSAASPTKGSIRVPARLGLREALQTYATEHDGVEASVTYTDFVRCIFRIAEKEEGSK
jgi:hypothetical protein